jgi:hypothetical protein
MNDMEKIKALKNALADIVDICNNDRIRPKIKLAVIEMTASLTLGLNEEKNNVYESAD